MRWMIAVMAAMLVQVAAAADTKVAVVDFERALFMSDAAKEASKKFEADNKGDIDKLNKLKAELVALQDKTKKEGDVMSDEERRKMSNDFEQKSTEYKFYARNLQQADQNWKNDFFKSQLPELNKLLKAIIDEGGYDVVLQASAVVYSSPKTDLTKMLLERLNSK